MTDKKQDDFGQAEVQKNVDAEQEQGFRGNKVDPRPNSDYSLESGPDSPGPGDAVLVNVSDLPHKEK